MNAKFDAIAVLASGVSKKGELYPDSRARMEKAALLFKRGIAPTLIMCGKHSGSLEFIPSRTEAHALRECAASLGIPKSLIALEKQSNDTMSNFLFLKKICIGRGIKSIAVVTSDFHAARARFLGRLVFGKTIRFRVFAAKRPITAEERRKRGKHEKEFIRHARKTLRGIKPGDSGQIERLWKEYWAGFEKGRGQKTEWYKPK